MSFTYLIHVINPPDDLKLTLFTLSHQFIGKPLLTQDLRVVDHLINQVLGYILVQLVKFLSQTLDEL